MRAATRATVDHFEVFGSGESSSADYERFTPSDALFLSTIIVSFLHVSALGQLYFSDVCYALIALTLAMIGGLRTLTRQHVVIIAASGAISVSSLLGAPLLRLGNAQILTGLATGLFFASNTIAIAWYIRGDRNRAIQVILALATAGLVSLVVQPASIDVLLTPWKFGFATPLALIAAALLSLQDRLTPSRKTIGALAFFGLAVVNFLFEFKSMSLICLLTAALVLYQQPAQTQVVRRAAGGLAFIFIFGLIAATAGTYGYNNVARQGYLGEAARVKAMIQSGNALTPFVTARPEAWYLIPAIASSPILGLGTGAGLPEAAANQGSKVLLAADAPALASEFAPGEPLPTHSHLLGGWAQYGIAAATLWLYSIGVAIRCVARTLTDKQPGTLFFFVSILLSWDILFSPFGAERRLQDAIFLSVLLVPTIARSKARSE